MKKTSSILILIAFCVYSFVFKTHYCYYTDTDIRFHGDCEHEIKDAAARGDLAKTNLFPKHYVCYDYFKDAKPNLSKLIVVKNTFDNIFIIFVSIHDLARRIQTVDWLIPEIKSRGGPPLISNSFRGPPLV